MEFSECFFINGDNQEIEITEEQYKFNSRFLYISICTVDLSISTRIFTEKLRYWSLFIQVLIIAFINLKILQIISRSC